MRSMRKVHYCSSRAFWYCFSVDCLTDYASQGSRLIFNQAFAVDQPGKILMWEFLLAAVHVDLLRRIKAGAARRGYKHGWVRSGEVCVRKLDGSDIAVIGSDLDLEKLEWQKRLRRVSVVHATSVCFSDIQSSLLCLFRILLSYYCVCLAFYKCLNCIFSSNRMETT